jgi:membrane protein implicated in regulation of membrane protease activity
MFTTLVVLAVLGVAAEAAIAVLSLTGGSEYLEFAIAMVLFVAILVGSYLFVLTSSQSGQQRGRREERGSEE